VNNISAALNTEPSRNQPRGRGISSSEQGFPKALSQSLSPTYSQQVEVPVTFVLADLGCAYWCSSQPSDYVQPAYLRAPEVILGYPWDTSIDIWSLGCLTFELLAGSELIVNFYIENTTEDEQNLACMEYFFGEQFDKELLLASPYSEDFFTSDGSFAHISSDGLERIRNVKKSISQRLAECGQLHKGSDELAGALAFLRRCLRLRSTERATASDLLKDPWLVGARPLTAGYYPPHHMHSILADMRNARRARQTSLSLM